MALIWKATSNGLSVDVNLLGVSWKQSHIYVNRHMLSPKIGCKADVFTFSLHFSYFLIMNLLNEVTLPYADSDSFALQ